MRLTRPSMRRLCLSLAVFLLLVLLLLAAHPVTRTRVLDIPLGPTYFMLRRQIARLPQHNLDLPLPEGRDGRYVKFSMEANSLGWNNCLNERLMNAHLAFMSNRAYVFADYKWADQHYPFPPTPRSGATTPFPALLAGPVVGGSWPSNITTHHPRSISARWWDTVCPPARRRQINTLDIKPHIPGGVDGASASLIFETWRTLLLDAPENCLEVVYVPKDIRDDYPQVFDLRLWGGNRVLSLWDEFSTSPVSTLLRPSDIVLRAIEGNIDGGVFLWLPGGVSRPPMSQTGRNPFPRMLAVHLRRGDYIGHCRMLAAWGSGHYGWSQLSFLPDVLNRRLPAGDDPQREEKAFRMCLPDVDGVVQRVAEVQREWLAHAAGGERVDLDLVYLLTNESGAFLDELVTALHTAGWQTVVTTRDLRLNTEQRDVSMAVDMEIAKRAAVFVGNGWSSFTSNVIHQRLVDGKEPMSTRLL
ncbi:hypothetical protein C8F01DRAFT_1151915 [Mycena amicta]|nr:hypothetical protein C8F01DRAFT_1151915 [Mycena amicta]